MHSGEVLLVLTRAGISREEAYAIVQRSAMATWTGLGKPDGRSFRAHLDADPQVAGRISRESLDEAMRSERHLNHIDTIFERVFNRVTPGHVSAAVAA